MKRATLQLFLISLTSALVSVAWSAIKPSVDRVVTVTEGTNIAATIAPDANGIVMDLQGVLWSLPFKGGEAKRLTDPMIEASRPNYSPKGDLVTFQAYKGGTFHIWVIRPDGAGLRQITEGHGDDREPRFSPDGTKIAFGSDRAFKGSYDIWAVDVSGGKLTEWTKSAEDEYEPAWSPDGSEVAFVSGVGANGTTIQAVNAEGHRRVLATAPHGAHLDSPTWSTNGKSIAYVQIGGGKSVMMIDGRKVGSEDDVFPFPACWLPGKRILYSGGGKILVTALGSGETSAVPFEAKFAFHLPGYRRKEFNLEPASDSPVKGIVSPALSPDGKQVIFEALNQLWLMEAGGKPKALTNDAFYKEDPSWSPDGKSVAYSSDKGGTEDLYVLNLETRGEKRITFSDDAAEVAAAWSPDGKKLAFQDQAGATFVKDLETGKQRQVIGAQFAPSKPSWSGHGDAISIGALKSYTRRFREGTSQILTVNLQTGKLTYSEPAPFGSLSTRGEDGPLYSPDGSWMAFVMGSVLWIRPVDEGGLPTGPARQITREVTDAPTWSGDSKQLLYLSNGHLRLIGLDGKAVRTLPVDLSWRSEQEAGETVIHAGRLWNGRGPDVQTDVDITIANKRIRSITPHSEAGLREARARGVAVVEAANLTVLPGLWESHTHEWIGGKFYGDRLGRLWLAYGVTELQSQGDPVYRSLETREAFGSGSRLGPRFFATGEAIDGERVYYNFMRPTTSDAQLKLELARAKELDYDNLKTYVRLPAEMQKTVAAFGHQQMGIVTVSHYMLPGLTYGVD
ncbi:MAG: amidohydrolase, partial [Acidobacteriota bacterium]|nr:amidohydrolase [Acidobacteriota bacterium]